MELLPKLTVKDYVHHAIALLAVLASGAIAFFAMQQIRGLTRSACVLAGCNGLHMRAVTGITWIVVCLAFAVYILAIQPLYTEGVTKARVWRAQERLIPYDVAQNQIKRWLWEHDLYYTAQGFLKTFWIPVVVYLGAYLLNEIFIRLAVR